MNIIDFFNRKIGIKVSDEVFKHHEFLSFMDVYTFLGIEQYMQQFISQTNEKRFTICNLKANSKTIDTLYSFLKNNLTKTKNKYSKMFKENKLDAMAAMDFLEFSPSTDNTVKDNYIEILKPNNKNYTKYKGL